MKHLKKFNESSDNKIDHLRDVFESSDNKLELLRDVFENLEDEFDVDVEYTHSGVSIYNSNAKSVSVSIKLRDYITREMVNEIIRLTNMAEKYCDLEFSIWSINTYAGSLINRSLRRGSDKPTGGKAPKDCIESMVDVLISGGTGNKIDGVIRRYSDDTVGTVVIEFSYND